MHEQPNLGAVDPTPVECRRNRFGLMLIGYLFAVVILLITAVASSLAAQDKRTEVAMWLIRIGYPAGAFALTCALWHTWRYVSIGQSTHTSPQPVGSHPDENPGDASGTRLP